MRAGKMTKYFTFKSTSHFYGIIPGTEDRVCTFLTWSRDTAREADARNFRRLLTKKPQSAGETQRVRQHLYRAWIGDVSRLTKDRNLKHHLSMFCRDAAWPAESLQHFVFPLCMERDLEHLTHNYVGNVQVLLKIFGDSWGVPRPPIIQNYRFAAVVRV